MSKKRRKRTTGKTTGKIQALDEEALKGICRRHGPRK